MEIEIFETHPLFGTCMTNTKYQLDATAFIKNRLGVVQSTLLKKNKNTYIYRAYLQDKDDVYGPLEWAVGYCCNGYGFTKFHQFRCKVVL